MLQTRFPRLPGDVGHPQAFGRPVRHRVVQGALAGRVVASADDLRASGLVPAFRDAALQLQDDGAAVVTTSCGFLVLLQDELSSALRVPVVTSSLLQLPALLAREPQVGVLTISAERLGTAHLLAAGVPRERLRDVVVQGVDPGGPFAGCILGDQPTMDVEGAARDVAAAACALRRRAPTVRVAVLECTNMPPHAAQAARASGLRLVSLLDDPRLA
jgi:hypothetical protein